MKRLTVENYWMGRDVEYPMSLTSAIRREAARTITLTNELLATAAVHGVIVSDVHPRTLCIISSGWRPPAVNAQVPGAAPNSKHMTGRAIDLYDPNGDLDDWLMTDIGRSVLDKIGLWMEHPASTKGWCHLQTVPPRSGNRCFFP